MQEPTEIELDEDQAAVAIRTLKDIRFAMATIGESLAREGKVNADLAKNALRVSEHYLADLGKVLGIPTQTEEELTERSAKLRAANLRVRELEKQLGNAQSPELTQMSLRQLADQLNAWWDLEGFGHISEIKFGAYGCEVDFSCHLFGNFRLIKSETPISDKERKKLWHESLQARGFRLTEEDRDACIEDCDQNRKVLEQLFEDRLPSSKVISFENYNKNEGGFVLRGVKVLIRRIDEFLTLPVPEQAED